MVIYTTPSVDVEFSMDDGVLFIKWKQKPETREFIEAYTKILNYVKDSYRTTLFCTDLSRIGSLKNEQEAWLNSEYYQLVYNNLQADIFVAVVFSEDHFKAIITNYKATETQPQHSFIRFNYFTELNEACHWLASIKKGQDTLVLPNFRA